MKTRRNHIFLFGKYAKGTALHRAFIISFSNNKTGVFNAQLWISKGA